MLLWNTLRFSLRLYLSSTKILYACLLLHISSPHLGRPASAVPCDYSIPILAIHIR